MSHVFSTFALIIYIFGVKLEHTTVFKTLSPSSNLNHHFNPCSPEGFSEYIFRRRGVANPLRIINNEGYKTLNLLPVYRYGHLSIDTKISTNH